MIGDMSPNREIIDYNDKYTHLERTEYIYYMHEVLLKSGNVNGATTLRELMYKTFGPLETTLADHMDFDSQCKDYQEFYPKMLFITEYMRSKRIDHILG